MYIISYKFIVPSRRNHVHNKCNLRIKPNNLDPIQKGIELLLLSIDTTRQPRGAQIDAGERSNSVEGRVLNPLSYLEIASQTAFILGRESRLSAILTPEFRRGIS